jgi:protein-S-isoprenylcysteine O-methyltransferase Ste14
MQKVDKSSDRKERTEQGRQLIPGRATSQWRGRLSYLPFSYTQFIFDCRKKLSRLLDEEKLLAKDLPGYADYQQKIRSRLIPYIW